LQLLFSLNKNSRSRQQRYATVLPRYVLQQKPVYAEAPPPFAMSPAAPREVLRHVVHMAVALSSAMLSCSVPPPACHLFSRPAVTCRPAIRSPQPATAQQNTNNTVMNWVTPPARRLFKPNQHVEEVMSSCPTARHATRTSRERREGTGEESPRRAHEMSGAFSASSAGWRCLSHSWERFTRRQAPSSVFRQTAAEYQPSIHRRT